MLNMFIDSDEFALDKMFSYLQSHLCISDYVRYNLPNRCDNYEFYFRKSNDDGDAVGTDTFLFRYSNIWNIKDEYERLVDIIKKIVEKRHESVQNPCEEYEVINVITKEDVTFIKKALPYFAESIDYDNQFKYKQSPLPSILLPPKIFAEKNITRYGELCFKTPEDVPSCFEFPGIGAMQDLFDDNGSKIMDAKIDITNIKNFRFKDETPEDKTLRIHAGIPESNIQGKKLIVLTYNVRKYTFFSDSAGFDLQDTYEKMVHVFLNKVK